MGLILSGQSKTEINSSYLGTTRDAIHFLIYLEIDYLDSFQLGKPSAIGSQLMYIENHYIPIPILQLIIMSINSITKYLWPNLRLICNGLVKVQ